MLTKNLAFLLKDYEGQAELASYLEVSQPTISKWASLYRKGSDSEPEFRKMAKLAKHFGVSVDDLANRDLEAAGPSRSSQSAKLDLDRLGHALTSIDKALANRKIRGSMGKLSNTLSFAYQMTEAFPSLMQDERQREAYDLLVRNNLVGELDGQRVDEVAGGGAAGSIETSPRKAEGGRRTARRKD